ncbi:hypothetical protein A0H81_05750 [Grifola frondosa]|uniref:DUF6534 domain-containing protein n=1 Tax=Grifola frondosa TaxID=5627 RepID=A0A1C7MD48_GRIFR|nr:hypothetical protein A0H81_05750 [Grifola frondosa]
MSTPAATPTNNFDVLGPALINVTVMLVLFGFTLIQTYMYYVRYPKDVPRMKLLVTVLLILDTLHVALVCHAQYIKLEVSWDAEKLLDGEWTLYANYAVNLVVCVLVQIHFTRTIYHLCQNRWRLWLTGLLTVLTIAHLGLGMATTVLIFKAWELSKVQAATDITLIPLAAARIASDLVIAISLCVLLHTHRTGVKRTNSVINTLIVYAINRFLLTTAISFIQLVVLSIDLLRLWSFGWSLDFVIGKLYLNSFLASVNSRTHLQDG